MSERYIVCTVARKYAWKYSVCLAAFLITLITGVVAGV